MQMEQMDIETTFAFHGDKSNLIKGLARWIFYEQRCFSLRTRFVFYPTTGVFFGTETKMFSLEKHGKNRKQTSVGRGEINFRPSHGHRRLNHQIFAENAVNDQTLEPTHEPRFDPCTVVLSQRLGNLVATNAIHCLAGVETSATWLQAHFYTSLVFTQQVDKQIIKEIIETWEWDVACCTPEPL